MQSTENKVTRMYITMFGIFFIYLSIIGFNIYITNRLPIHHIRLIVKDVYLPILNF